MREVQEWVMRILASLCFALASVAGCAQDSGSLAGRIVTSVVFDPPVDPPDPSAPHQPLTPGQIGKAIQVKERAPLKAEEVSQTIENLYATGRYRDIRAEGTADGPGVALRFITTNRFFVGGVRVEGKVPDPPNLGQLVSVAQLGLGKAFNTGDLALGQESIRKLLVQNGFYLATVRSRVDYDELTQRANVTFEVDSGQRARFTKPDLEGETVLSPETIIRATKWKYPLISKWRLVSLRKVQQGGAGVRDKYEKNDRLLATVGINMDQYDQHRNVAIPKVILDAGPKVAIKVTGFKISRKNLKRFVPVFNEHTVDRDLLIEGQRNLQEYMQSKGYFDAVVKLGDYNEERGPLTEIRYDITPGDRHRFVSVRIEGNKYFNESTIRERVFLTPKSFQFPQGRFSESLKRRDLDAIVNLYKANGFRDVVVTGETIDHFGSRVNDLGVDFHITEGPQWTVSKLSVSGFTRPELQSLINTLSCTAGQPYSEIDVASDRDTILANYYENGFPDANFDWSSKPSAEPHQVELEFKITEGRQQFVREVLVDGLNVTREKLAFRNLTLGPGDPLSPIRMSDTARRLYDLGIFAKVDMAIQNPDGDAVEKYVQYQIEEAKLFSVTFGVGAQIGKIGNGNSATAITNPVGNTSFSPRFSANITRLNLFGLGQTLTLQGQASSVQQQGSLTYKDPRIFGHDNLNLSVTTLYDNSNDVNTFSSRRAEGSVQLAYKISKPTTAFFRISYQANVVSNLKIDPLLIPSLGQSVNIGMFSINLVQDRRDDPLDATKGFFNSLDTGYATRRLGSQAQFVKMLGKNATYHRLTKKLVLARETSFGLIPNIGTTQYGDPDDPIPLSQRFYGGGESHRGFPYNGAGPRDLETGFALGGSALLFNRTEARFPLLGANLNGVLFEDFGNIFAKVSDISFKVRQDNLTDFKYMVHAVGFGLRYKTPIGPVRLDLAYAINPTVFDGFEGSYNDLVNCTAANNCVTARLSTGHIQFQFSIGQAF